MSVLAEKLYASHLLLELADDRLRPNRQIVEQAMHRGSLGIDWEDTEAIDSLLVAALRTAGLFVLDQDESAAALLTMPPELPTLPPLPFPRIAVEMSRIVGERQDPVPFGRLVTGEDGWRISEVYEESIERAALDVDTWEIPLVVVLERVPRYVWDILIPFHRQRPTYLRTHEGVTEAMGVTDQITVAALQLTPAGITDSLSDSVDQVRIWMKEWAERNVVNIAHLLTARGVPRTPVQVARPQRRRWQKRHGVTMPTIYRVDLHAAGEDKPATSTREYHVRWIVRGHWRHLAHGRETCTCAEHRWNPQPATWIEPHVKGPANAPWSGPNAPRFKGKPVYFQRKPERSGTA